MTALLEILIIVAAGAAIVAATGGLLYVAGLAVIEERQARRHMLANAFARRARTESQIPKPDARRPRTAVAAGARR